MHLIKASYTTFKVSIILNSSCSTLQSNPWPRSTHALLFELQEVNATHNITGSYLYDLNEVPSLFEMNKHYSYSSMKKVHLLFVSHIKIHQNISFDLCRFLSWFRPEHFITGARVIMDYGYSNLVKDILMLYLFQLLMLTDGLECCAVFIRLLFWRHPFTTEHPLMRHISTNLM